jgi:hypothetical protein
MLTDSQIARFLDVDFGSAAAANGRMMGCNPRVEPVGLAGFPTYSDALKARGESLLSMDEIDALIEKYTREGWPARELCTYVHDQNGEPSCVSNAKLAQHEIAQAFQFGLENVTILSPISVYRFVGSPRSGSMLIDNLRRMQTVGALPLDNDRNRAKFKHVHPHNGYSKPMPAGYEETAALFQDAEYADIENWHEYQDSLVKGRTNMYARGGHCILGVSVTKSGNGKTGDYLNSWSESFGNPVNERLKGGLGHDSERTMQAASRGAIAVLNVKVPFTGVAA